MIGEYTEVQGRLLLELARKSILEEFTKIKPDFPAGKEFKQARGVLEENELKEIKIELSILTIPEDTAIKDIKIGQDGLICDYLGYSGLLLPQVAVENKFSKVKFLECLCNKAGLPKDTWSKLGFKLKRFQAQIFKEK